MVLQEGAAGRADAEESAQDDAAQVQAPVAAAAVKQDASNTTDIAAYVPAQDWLANLFTHVVQDVDGPAKHAGDFFKRHNAFLLPPFQPVLCVQSGILPVQSWVALQRHTVAGCTLVTVMGLAQQGTQALRHRLEARSPAGQLAQSAQRSLQRQCRCAILGSALAPIVSLHALVARPVCECCPKACVEEGTAEVVHTTQICSSAYSRQQVS